MCVTIDEWQYGDGFSRLGLGDRNWRRCADIGEKYALDNEAGNN
jgi:hypothetical protein